MMAIDSNVYQFNTSDMRFRLTIERPLMDRILGLCIDASGIETGGILIGHYNDEHYNAIVTDVSASPSDSRRRRTSFDRGVKGLQTWLNRLWEKERRYYLGEWHFHPFASPNASMTDHEQMRRYSKTESLHCPEPVMLVIGGDPRKAWTAKAYVSPRDRPFHDMLMAEMGSRGCNG